ncbi:MAG TPA: hypothetical protein VM890_14615 [Longimicrobium sp.]|jgi:hypothetical protein|nr:hypothetical protein [Longimicrobium sp.]
MRSRFLPTLLCALVLLAPRALAAQGRAVPLEGFVASVARLWTQGDAAGISALAPEDGRIVLDLGTGQAEAVEARHAAAALRDLFRGRSTLSVRAAQVTLAGGEPMRGFGELAWVSRPRGVTDTESTTVYVGAVWEPAGWRIRELRILR